MPTYEYHCSACSQDMEIFQSMKEPPLTACPSCRKKGKIQRRISGGAGIIFKGSGFYETDYKKQPEKATTEAKSSDSGSESPKDKGSSTEKPKTESKPKESKAQAATT